MRGGGCSSELSLQLAVQPQANHFSLCFSSPPSVGKGLSLTDLYNS